MLWLNSALQGWVVGVAPGPLVALLTVRAGGRQRTIGGTRLRRPLTVTLTHRRMTIAITVKLRDGRRGRRTVTITRCR